MASVSIVTPPGLLAFPTLFTAKPRFQGGDPCFQAILVFSAEAQKSAEYKALKEACIDAAKNEFGSAYNPNVLKWPFRKGEEKPNYAGFDPGTIFITAWTKTKPGIIDGSLNEVNDPNAVWAGQIARFSVSPFAYNQSGNKGVSLALRNVQLLRMDTARLDGRASAKNDFGGAAVPAGFEAEMEEDTVPF
jgi:hypothetical protein